MHSSSFIHSFSFSLSPQGIEKSFLADAMSLDAGAGSGDWFDEGTFISKHMLP